MQFLFAVDIHRVSKKIVQNYFYNNVKFPPAVKSSVTKIANRLTLCEVRSFSTSPNSRQRTTMLNADVPNCYIAR